MKPNKKQLLIYIGFVLVAIIVFLLTRATKTRENIPTINNTENPSFSVKLTKKQTNELINFYLDDYQKNSNIKYTFYLENVALLQGDFEFLGSKMKLYFYLEPNVIENGNIEFDVISISIGTLELPRKEILKYIEKNYKIPEWVEMKEEKIIMHLDQFKLKNNIYFSSNKIDLINDQIEMNVFLPTVGN